MLMRATALAATLVVLVGSFACGDDPFLVRWVENPREVTLYSLDRPEVNLPSAYNFIQRESVRIESAQATNRWDMALDSDGEDMYFLPPGALGVDSRARIAAVPGSTFEEVVEAPADTARYSASDPVPVELGTIYVIRTREESGNFGQRCVYYAKLEPLEIDAEQGILSFVYDASPACNNRRLVPPND